MADYIPPKDADFANWSANFSAVVGTNPTDYGLDAADGTTITDTDTSFQAAYGKAIDPLSRTSVTVAAKDTERTTAESVYRGYANQIQANPAITDEQLTAAGLTVRKTTPSPPVTPGSAPTVTIVGAINGHLELRWQNPETPDSKARPNGSVGVQFDLQCRTADDTGWEDADPDQIITGRNPCLIPFNNPDPSRRYRVRGRFLGGRDQNGNISNGPKSAWQEFNFTTI